MIEEAKFCGKPVDVAALKAETRFAFESTIQLEAFAYRCLKEGWAVDVAGDRACVDCGGQFDRLKKIADDYQGSVFPYTETELAAVLSGDGGSGQFMRAVRADPAAARTSRLEPRIDPEKYMIVTAFAVVKNKQMADRCSCGNLSGLRSVVLQYGDGERVVVPARLIGAGKLGYDPALAIEDQARAFLDDMISRVHQHADFMLEKAEPQEPTEASHV